jgi:beta-glucanase (GH16 family)
MLGQITYLQDKLESQEGFASSDVSPRSYHRRRTYLPRRLLGAAAFGLVVTVVSTSVNSRNIDLSQYHETFAENFREVLDVTPWGPSKWIAHTPWHGDFGDARFADPQPNFPFTKGAGGLKITARKDRDGKWVSGLLCSVDPKGRGFTQAGGYFEARMKMPPGPGVWPAFWLAGGGDANYKAEIDVVEYYGQFPDGYHIVSHLWPRSKDTKKIGEDKFIHVPENSLTDTFHTYGVDILDDEMVFYLDRQEVARMKAAPAAHAPLAILVNLALGSGWPIDKTYNPSVLEVDYIKAFAKN